MPLFVDLGAHLVRVVTTGMGAAGTGQLDCEFVLRIEVVPTASRLPAYFLTPASVDPLAPVGAGQALALSIGAWLDSSGRVVGVTGAGGGALPSWLSFNASSAVLSGAPPDPIPCGSNVVEVVFGGSGDAIVETLTLALVVVRGGAPSSPTCAHQCPPGQYSPSPSAPACVGCPPGRFGAGVGLTTALCSGACALGFTCPAGSTSPEGGARVVRAPTFSPPQLLAALPTIRGAYGCDANRDGRLDVFTASLNHPVGSEVRWLHSTSTAPLNFTAFELPTGAAVGARSVVAADLDRDGDIDAITAHQYEGTVAWFENTGAPSFVARTVATGVLGAWAVFAADVDR